jgi:hypothetical protein
VVSVIGAAVVLVSFRARADEKPGKDAPRKPAEAQSGEKLKALLQERRAFAKQQFDSSRRDASEVLKAFAFLKDKADQLGQARTEEDKRIISQLQMARLLLPNAQQQLYRWAQRLLAAELERSDKKADRVAAYEAHLQRMKEVEDEIKKGVKGGEDVVEVTEGKFHRLEAEIMLERAKAN